MSTDGTQSKIYYLCVRRAMLGMLQPLLGRECTRYNHDFDLSWQEAGPPPLLLFVVVTTILQYVSCAASINDTRSRIANQPCDIKRDKQSMTSRLACSAALEYCCCCTVLSTISGYNGFGPYTCRGKAQSWALHSKPIDRELEMNLSIPSVSVGWFPRNQT